MSSLVTWVIEGHCQKIRDLTHEHGAAHTKTLQLGDCGFAQLQPSFSRWWYLGEDTLWTACYDGSTNDVVLNILAAYQPKTFSGITKLTQTMRRSIIEEPGCNLDDMIHLLATRANKWEASYALFSYSNRLNPEPSSFYVEDRAEMEPFCGLWRAPFESSNTAQWVRHMTQSLWTVMYESYCSEDYPAPTLLTQKWTIAKNLIASHKQALQLIVSNDMTQGPTSLELPSYNH